MQYSDLPRRLPIPFGSSAGGGFIRTVPVASQIGTQDGAASLTDGFPPLTFDDVGAGGVPPFGQDFNGILFDATGWARWVAAGAPVTYNSSFSTAIGGYPSGAVLNSTTPGIIWVSTADNNTTDPDGGSPANWSRIASANTSPNAESVTLPNGKILKDGVVSTTYTAGQTVTISFGTAFPNACRSVIVVAINSNSAGNKDNFVQIVSWNASGFTFVVQGTSTGGDNTINGITWDAKGY